jgi:hypothetical protein
MSLFSSLILPHLERELIALEPQIAQFLLNQLKNAADEVVAWAESKLNTDLNGDGKIGHEE